MEIKSLSKYVSWIPALLISQGLIHLFYYYNSFDIQIQSFLDFTEILVSFTEILGTLIIMFIVVTLFYATMGNGLLKEVGEFKTSFFKEESFWKRFKLEVKVNRVMYIGMSLSAIIVFIYLLIEGLPITFSRVMSLFAGFLVPLSSYFMLEIERYAKAPNLNNVARELVGLMPIFILISVTTFILTKIDAHAVKLFHKNIGIKIEFLDGKILTSDSSNFYIGNTRNFLFYYKKKEKIAEVYKMENVKKLTFPSLSN